MTIGSASGWAGLGWAGLVWLSMSGCTQEVATREDSVEAAALAVAEKFISAFYSWDPALLAAQMLPGEDADRVLYYQGWAQAARYTVQQRRPCTRVNDGKIQCAITVTDDFGEALGYTATDTFTLAVQGSHVTQVTFAGDDPPIFNELFAWLGEHRPAVLTGPCKDLFAGGETPAACARAVVLGAREFMAQRPN